jgi:hypothetical protein
LSPG